MKTLFIARHGKSSWANPNIKDIERTLDPSGIDGVNFVSNSIKEAGYHLDLLISSPATRAQHTARIHSNVLEFPESNIDTQSSVYYKGEVELLEMLLNQNSEYNSIMVCGHNPTFTNFVNHFIIHPINNLQTSGVVQLDFDINSWSELRVSKPQNAVYYKRNGIKDLIDVG